MVELLDEAKIKAEIAELQEKIKLIKEQYHKIDPKLEHMLKPYFDKKIEDANNLIKALHAKIEYLNFKLNQSKQKDMDLELRKRITGYLELADKDSINMLLSENAKRNLERIANTVGTKGNIGRRSKILITEIQVNLNGMLYKKFSHVRDSIYGLKRLTVEQFIDEITRRGAQVYYDENTKILYITDPNVKGK